MKRRKFKFFFITVFMLLITFFHIVVSNAEKGTDSEKYNIIKDALSRSIVQCYAIEGFYPPDVKYLEKNYGLIIPHDKYIVSYNVFASNIMPEFDVFNKP